MELVHPSQRKMYRFAIGNITEELLSRCCDLIWIAMGDDQFAFVATPRKPNPSFNMSDLELCVKEAQQVIQAFYRLSATVSMVLPFDDYTHIAHAYVEAQDLILYRMIYGRNTIITPDIVKLDERKEEFLKPADLEKLIVDELRRGNSAEMEKHLDAFFQYAASLNYTHFMHAVLHLTMTVTHAISEMNENRLRPVGIDLRHFYREVLEQETAEEIQGLFRTLAAQIADQSNIGENHKVKVLCHTIKEMIVENCADADFSQQTIAQMLKMSSAYIGRVFKQGTGAAVTEYINDIRLSNALALLEADHININEIMERVGYRSQSYFFKLFKTKYGTTPKEYRLKKVIKLDEYGT